MYKWLFHNFSNALRLLFLSNWFVINHCGNQVNNANFVFVKNIVYTNIGFLQIIQVAGHIPKNIKKLLKAKFAPGNV